MIYSDRLKNIRECQNLKQSDIANILNIERNTYNQYENENIIMPIKHLVSLSNYFNVSIDYLLNFNNIIKYENHRNQLDKIKSGQRLKEFRKKNNLTQAKLAEILNTAKPVICKYEKGINLIATPFLYTICKKYKISADYLLGKIDNPKYLK